jgi:hypothetical protein
MYRSGTANAGTDRRTATGTDTTDHGTDACPITTTIL